MIKITGSQFVHMTFENKVTVAFHQYGCKIFVKATYGFVDITDKYFSDIDRFGGVSANKLANALDWYAALEKRLCDEWRAQAKKQLEIEQKEFNYRLKALHAENP